MKRFIFLLTTIFICTIARADEITINWMNTDKTIDHTTTCTIGGDVTLPYTPTKYGYTFQGWAANYTPIEYIESTGTQYIDTGVSPTTYTFAEMEVNFASNGNGYRFFGTGNSISVGFGNSNQSQLYVNKAIVSGLDFSKYYNKRIRINLQGSTISINDIVYNVSSSVRESSQNIYINARADSLNERIGRGKWYGVKIGIFYLNKETLIRDFIPVLDKDGIPCMYDKVEGKFYYAQGSGDFIDGPAL